MKKGDLAFITMLYGMVVADENINKLYDIETFLNTGDLKLNKKAEQKIRGEGGDKIKNEHSIKNKKQKR